MSTHFPGINVLATLYPYFTSENPAGLIRLQGGINRDQTPGTFSPL